MKKNPLSWLDRHRSFTVGISWVCLGFVTCWNSFLAVWRNSWFSGAFAMGAFIGLLVLVGFELHFQAYKKGIQYGLSTVPQLVMDAVSQVQLAGLAIQSLGMSCEICGAERGLAPGGRMGPGDPPMYWELWVRCPDHADLGVHPPSKVISHPEMSGGDS